MKINDRSMKELLNKYGFFQESPNTYTRDIWTVRFFDNEIEIFDDPFQGGEGKYFIGDVDLIDLEAILEDM
jgi:hypothetical protein